VGFACMFAGCAGSSAASGPTRGSGLRLNELQVIGTHNSYKKAIQPELLEHMIEQRPGAISLDYQHLSLSDQLSLGVRNLELDVYWDPEGGRYADPLGNRLLEEQGIEPWPLEGAAALYEVGFKVIHGADFDFRTHHVRLEDALSEMREWSESNGNHVPIVVTVNTKYSKQDVPGAVDPAAFDELALRRLNDTIVAELAGRLLTPDDVRQNAESVAEGIRDFGWPRIDDVRGEYLFVLDQRGDVRSRYLEAYPGLFGAVFFTLSSGAELNSGFYVINDPVRDEHEIRKRVDEGYMVRTRADAGTHEARDDNLTRFRIARDSGAQVITTDYPIPDRRVSDRYMVRFGDGGFVRANPVTAGPAAPIE
ncbi:MAG: Ca2+-dependent phosphoinositide-specific phospholipase C, partial [Pseudomonadota bacterium]